MNRTRKVWDSKLFKTKTDEIGNIPLDWRESRQSNVLKGNSMKDSFKDGRKEVDKNESICDKNRRQKAGNILRIGEYSRQSLNKASTIGLDRQISTRKSWRTLQSPRQSRHVNYARTTSRHVKNETENVRWRNFSTENQAGIFDAGSEATQGSQVEEEN